MGNKGSTEAPVGLSASQLREENVYEENTSPSLASIVRPSLPPSLPPPPVAGTPPPVIRSFPDHRPRSHGLERRSMTVVGRGEQPRRDEMLQRRLSSGDASLPSDSPLPQDSLQNHVVMTEPQMGEEGVELATVIAVTFDRDVVTVNSSKLFEVKSDLENLESSQKPLQGRATYDAKTLKAEFVPHNILHPDATYTVTLLGHAVTTVQCSSSDNITNTQFTFRTCNPPPKNIGIKMKGQRGEVNTLQIDNYYDLYNSLIVWSTRQWGCSGEHIVGLYVEGEERGRLQVLKADHDVLRLRDNEVVVVEIKD